MAEEKLHLDQTSPIFIGGLFKSGTTLIRAMLGQHSAIAAGLETQWFNIDWESNRNDRSHKDIERLGHFYGIDQAKTDELVTKSHNINEFLDLFLGYYAASLGKRRWAEKTPGNILHLDKILDGWPSVKVIHVIRDPRDVFASLKQAKKWDTCEVFSELWCLYLGSVQKFRKTLDLSDQCFLEIRYEALVVQPEEAMKRVIAFVGEEWEEGIQNFQGQQGDYDRVLKYTGKASTTLERLKEPLRRKKIGIWKDNVTEDEMNTIYHEVEKRGLLNLMKRIEKGALQ
ncbi:MAG: sulfotransferase [Deltaproteobacteria bacterium]|nr:sulfotransferase [Deltaproteobacteria bacterium]